MPRLESIFPGFYNALDHGCKADGKTGSPTNNFTPLQNLLNSVKSGCVVWVPPYDPRTGTGCYGFGTSTGLVVPQGVTLMGGWISTPTMMSSNVSDAIVTDPDVRDDGTVFLVKGGSGVSPTRSAVNTQAMVRLQGNRSGIKGIGFHYPDQVTTSPPTAYPPAISVEAGYNSYVGYCGFHLAYAGIYCFGAYRPFIENCEGQTALTMLYINDCRDVARVLNLHEIRDGTSSTDGFTTWSASNGIAFDIARTDDMTLDGCFAFQKSIAFKVGSSPVSLSDGISTPWVTLHNCKADVCTTGIRVESSQGSFPIMIKDCMMTTCTNALTVAGGSVDVTGCWPRTMNN